MKAFISQCLILLFSITSYCQFQKEAEYPSREVKRLILQDQAERYFFHEKENTQIKIANESHQIIDSLPAPPCEGTFRILDARNDFDQTDFGVLCSCFTFSESEGPNFDYYLLDADGNTLINFNTFSLMDDRYIIDYDFEEFETTIYDTQSLEVISTKQQLSIIESNPNHNEGEIYFAYNGIDSIFVLDETLTTTKAITWEFTSDENTIRFSAASSIQDGSATFYIRIAELDPISSEVIYSKLIDDSGTTLTQFESASNTFHKYEQNLQVLAFVQQGVSSYNINNNEFNVVSTALSGVTSILQSGKYSIIKYSDQSGLVEFLDFDLQFANLVELETGLATIPEVFYDNNGTEFFWFSPLISSPDYSAIYKENIFLQRIDDSQRITPSIIENLPMKLFSRSSIDDELTEVYGLTPSSTKNTKPNTFKLSPNPVTDQLYISTDQEFRSYVILDNTGRAIETKLVSADQFSIEVNHLEPGIYFLKLQSFDNQTQPQKFIKIK